MQNILEENEHLNLALTTKQYFMLIKISSFLKVEPHRDTSELIDGR